MTVFALANLVSAAVFTSLFVWKRNPVYVGLAVLNGGIFLGLMMRITQ